MDAVSTLRQLYKENPDSAEKFRYGVAEKSLEEHFASVEQEPLKEFSFRKLEKFRNHFSLKILITYLPTQAVFERLGFDALYWGWCHCSSRERTDELASDISRLTGRDDQVMEQARLAAWQLVMRYDAHTVFRTEETIMAANNGYLGTVDLKQLLRACALPGVTISDSRAKDYRIVPFNGPKKWGEGWEDTQFAPKLRISGLPTYEIWMDGPIGFGLLYKEVPNAVVTFTPQSPYTLSLLQIQGIRGMIFGPDLKPVKRTSARGLAPLDWQKLMVRLGEEFAKALSFRGVSIRSAHNNKWTRLQKGKIHIPLEAALQEYDAVAERLGYRQRSDKNWYRQLR